VNRYDARQQFIEGLEQYIAGIETDQGLLRLARNVSAYHGQMPAEAYRLVKAILETREGIPGSYAGAAQALQQRLAAQRSERAA
jgi:hypothetical protein